MSFLDNIKEVPITDFAQRCGYTLVRKGKYYSLKEHDSVMIDVQKNCFWRNSCFVKGYGGHAGSVIDFAIEFNGAEDAKKAMRQIALMYGIEGEEKAKKQFQKPVTGKPEKCREYKPGQVELPEKDKDNRNVYAYLLKTRGIEQSIIRFFLGRNMLYQDIHKNCVFHTGTVFGCLRGTDTRRRFVLDLEGNDYLECFYFRGSEKAKTLIVAESVIDIMSLMSAFSMEGMNYVDYCYLALAGTGKLESVFYHVDKEAGQGTPFEHVWIATDNDEGGKNAALIIEEGLDARGIHHERFMSPKGKDWNDYLVEKKKMYNA